MRGAVVVDAGAEQKLRDEGKSLLPVGITEVRGEFARGDVIAVRNVQDQEIARGLANFSSDQAKLIMRQASSEFERILGFVGDAEMIHRDNLVLSDSQA